MIEIECPDCEAPFSRLARSCPNCGAPNGRRLESIAVIASLAIFIVMVAVAAYAIMRWQQPMLASTQPTLGSGEVAKAPATADNFSWLSDAMHECEGEAIKESSLLYFFVIPLAAAKNDEPDWQAKSLNDIGNGILLTAEHMFEGLRNGSLRLYKGEYVFRVRDEATTAAYQWKPAAGVAKFSTAEGDAIETFKIQFRTVNRASEDDWGAGFVRQRATCYWVNAIIGN